MTPSSTGRGLTVSFASTGTLFRASQFLAEELPIRLAHRVEELTNLPDGLNEMPSVRKVQDWYAQSFEVRSSAIRKVCSVTHTDSRHLTGDHRLTAAQPGAECTRPAPQPWEVPKWQRHYALRSDTEPQHSRRAIRLLARSTQRVEQRQKGPRSQEIFRHGRRHWRLAA